MALPVIVVVGCGDGSARSGLVARSAIAAESRDGLRVGGGGRLRSGGCEAMVDRQWAMGDGQ